MVTHCCSTHAIPLSNSPTTAPHLHTSFATLPHSHTQPFTFHSLSHLSPILLPLLEHGQKKSATLRVALSIYSAIWFLRTCS